jgi:hypothetical protein
MTRQGTAHARFQRAIRGGHLLNAEIAARELGALSLSDSLALVLLYQRQGSDKFERGARRWVRRVQVHRSLRHREVELLRGRSALSGLASARSRSTLSWEPVAGSGCLHPRFRANRARTLRGDPSVSLYPTLK